MIDQVEILSYTTVLNTIKSHRNIFPFLVIMSESYHQPKFCVIALYQQNVITFFQVNHIFICYSATYESNSKNYVVVIMTNEEKVTAQSIEEIGDVPQLQ